MPGSYLELPASGADVRAPLELDARGLAEQLQAASQLRAALATPTYHAASVTARVKDGQAAHMGSPGGKGATWGTAVHGLLEAALRGARGESLRETARGLLLAYERELDAGGTPVELNELLALVEAVRVAPLWQRAEAAEQRLAEVHFALPLTAEAYRALVRDLPGANAGAEGAAPDAPLEVIEGVIDLAFREAEGWTLADYKSDAAGRAIDPALMERYRAQLELYARAWERLTNEPVRERVLFFTADGHPERW
jgi:ATP-dependent exoDNAse (exonuclease V) beta subunit